MEIDWIEVEQDETREWQARRQGKMNIEGQIAGRREWDGYCVGSVEFSTNGPQGGDAGWGGFLRIRFTNAASTCMEVAVDGAKSTAADSIAITFRADAEMEAAIESIEFLAAKLKAIRDLRG